MNVEQIRKMLRAHPFQAFDIHLADGRSLPVVHPEVVAIAPPGRTIGVGLADDTVETVDLLRVTSLKPDPMVALSYLRDAPWGTGQSGA